MQFQQVCPKDKKNYSSFNFFGGKLGKISIDGVLWCASRGIDNFSLSQLFGQYVNGKLSISRFEILIMKGLGLLIMKGIGLLIMKGIGLLILKGIELFIMKGIGLLMITF